MEQTHYNLETGRNYYKHICTTHTYDERIDTINSAKKAGMIICSGGRSVIDEFGKNCFNAGANATITGNYLTTSGNKICDDKEMIEELKMEVIEND